MTILWTILTLHSLPTSSTLVSGDAYKAAKLLLHLPLRLLLPFPLTSRCLPTCRLFLSLSLQPLSVNAPGDRNDLRISVSWMIMLWQADTPNAGSPCFLTEDVAATPRTKTSTLRFGTLTGDHLNLALLVADILSFHETRGIAPPKTLPALTIYDLALFPGIG